jgi:hypothetical protein
MLIYRTLRGPGSICPQSGSPISVARWRTTCRACESGFCVGVRNCRGRASGSPPGIVPWDSAESSEKQLQDRDLEVGEALNILKGITFSRLQVD